MTKFDLTFEDGTERTITRKPVHLMRTEQVGGKPGVNEQVLVSLWFADTKRPALDRKDFDAWAESLEDWAIQTEDDTADPPDRTPGGSPG